MGLFNLEKKQKQQLLTQQFKLINGYASCFSTFSGGLYEMELIRSSIETISTHASKLNPCVVSSGKYKKIEKILQMKPNNLMTTQQFISRLITILKCENNAFIIPIYSDITATEIVGFYPARANGSSIVNLEGTDFLKYKIENEYKYIEYSRVGHLKNHYYSKEVYGDGNDALRPTLELIHTQNQGIIEGIKKSASIRFLARLANVLRPEDIKAERERLEKDNLSANNNNGILIFDNKYSDIKNIESKPFIVNDKQAEQIKQNVFSYFHVSENIIQNKASEDEWNSFYEGCIEPLAIQLSQVLTSMLFTNEEIRRGYNIFFESSKLQFASNNTKLNISTQLFDRGVLTTNQVMDIWNMPHVENGDKRYIRKEYAEVNKLDGGDNDEKSTGDGNSNDGQGTVGDEGNEEDTTK